jgi:tetratricopeptide (TPR) repeat protein
MTIPSYVMLLPLLFSRGDGDGAPGAAPAAAPKTADAAKRADGGPAKKAAEALGEAAKLKRSAAGKKDEEKLDVLTKAASAYEQVARDFLTDVETAAEANFRAGEIWRTVKRNEDARRCFTGAANCAAAPEWSARGWLELGHIARRLRKLEEAFKTYGKVLEVAPQQRSQCVDALTWQGRVLIDQKQETEGQALLLSIGARFPDYPVDDIRNVDDVAVDWIRAGRVDEASKLVLDCVDRHTHAADGKEPSDAVRRALEHMKSRELLAAPKEMKEGKDGKDAKDGGGKDP